MVSKPVLTRFPFINLSKSLERAKAIYENDKGGKGLKMPVAFAAWGYSDKSSGGFQTVAALKSYGLLEDEGANDDRAVKLTGDAREYFQTEIEADHNRLQAKFAGRPPLMAHLLNHWDGGTVADPVARTYLKTGIGLNEQSARSALGIYKDNLSFIGAKGPGKDSGMAEERDADVSDDGVIYGGARVGDFVDYETGGLIANPVPLKVRALSADQAWVFVEGSETGLEMDQVIVKERPAAPFPPQVAIDQAFGKTRIPPKMPLQAQPDAVTADNAPIPKGYRSETFDADEGTITITWPENMSAQSVDDMKDWLELLKRRIERRATKGDAA